MWGGAATHGVVDLQADSAIAVSEEGAGTVAPRALRNQNLVRLSPDFISHVSQKPIIEKYTRY